MSYWNMPFLSFHFVVQVPIVAQTAVGWRWVWGHKSMRLRHKPTRWSLQVDFVGRTGYKSWRSVLGWSTYFLVPRCSQVLHPTRVFFWHHCYSSEDAELKLKKHAESSGVSVQKGHSMWENGWISRKSQGLASSFNPCNMATLPAAAASVTALSRRRI